MDLTKHASVCHASVCRHHSGLVWPCRRQAHRGPAWVSMRISARGRRIVSQHGSACNHLLVAVHKKMFIIVLSILHYLHFDFFFLPMWGFISFNHYTTYSMLFSWRGLRRRTRRRAQPVQAEAEQLVCLAVYEGAP